MPGYVVAIPTYKRHEILEKKSLKTLIDGGVSPSKIYIFLANEEEKEIYEKEIPKSMYHKLVVGVKGIANQRKFMVKYFKEGEHVVSIDDDVEALFKFQSSTKLTKMTDIDKFFKEAFQRLHQEKLFIWGIYPVNNAFFMKDKVTTDLKFIIGVLRGFINRHDKDLEPSEQSEGKEDYEQSILYFKKDGGVLRYNNVTPKTKFNSVGGLGKDRFDMNKKAAAYLKKTYPDIITIFHRKNGMTEVKLKKMSSNSSEEEEMAEPKNKTKKRTKTGKRKTIRNKEN